MMTIAVRYEKNFPTLVSQWADLLLSFGAPALLLLGVLVRGRVGSGVSGFAGNLSLFVHAGSILGLWMLAFSKSTSRRVMAVLVLAASFFLVPAILGWDGTRMQASFYYVRSVDFLLRTGRLNRTIDAFQNWPGAAILYAFLREITGYAGVQPVISLAPFILTLLYLPGLLAFASVHNLRTRAWFAVAYFLIFNWTSQNYYSAQGAAYAVLLSSLLLVLIEARKYELRLGRLLVIFFISFLGLTISHFLTSIFFIALLFLLSFFIPSSRRALLVAAAIFIAWNAYVSADFVLSAFLSDLTYNPLRLLKLLLAGRLVETSEAHAAVNKFRLVFSSLAILVAATGMWAYLRSADRGLLWRSTCVFHLCVIAASVGLAALTAYGGEIVIRAFFYSLPSLGFFASYAVGAPRMRPLALILVMLAVPMHFVAHYGNEVVDYIPKSHLRAAYFYRERVMSRRAVLSIPFIGLDRIEDQIVVFKAGSIVEKLSVDLLGRLKPDTVALNDNVRDTLQYFYGDRATFGAVVRHLTEANDYNLSYANGHAWVYKSR